jgi:hypothetical protein
MRGMQREARKFVELSREWDRHHGPAAVEAASRIVLPAA